MAKLTSSRAVTPPNVRVMLLTSSTGSATGTFLLNALFELLDLLLHPACPNRTARREDALRPVDRQDNQGSSEQHHAPLLETAEPLGQVGDDRRAYHHAPPVALAAYHDGGDEQDGEQQQEGLWADESLTSSEQCAGEPADEGPHRESQQLELEGGHPHQLGCVLVLPSCLPGSPDPTVLDQLVSKQHQDDHGQREPVIRNQVNDAESQEDRGLPQVQQRHSRIPTEVWNLEQLDARRSIDPGDTGGSTQPRSVDQGEPHDLTEAERDNGQIVTPHPKGWRAQCKPGKHRHTNGHGNRQQVRPVPVFRCEN